MAQNQLWDVKKTRKKGPFYRVQHQFWPIKFIGQIGRWEAKIIEKTRFFDKKRGKISGGEKKLTKIVENPGKLGRSDKIVQIWSILGRFLMIFLFKNGTNSEISRFRGRPTCSHILVGSVGSVGDTLGKNRHKLLFFFYFRSVTSCTHPKFRCFLQSPSTLL